MLLFGHKFIPSQNFYHVFTIDAIIKTPPNAIIYLEFFPDNLDIITYLQNNHINFALRVKDITSIIYASALGASFIIVPKQLAHDAQNIAQNYLFDAKIIVHIEDENEIEPLAIQGIDGVIFSNAIIKINS